jgi:hypothetical protein
LFKFKPKIEKFLALMLGEESEETFRRPQLLLRLLIQRRLWREREGISRVYLDDVMHKEEANDFMDIESLFGIVEEYVSDETEVPTMFGAVLSPIVVGFYPS